MAPVSLNSVMDDVANSEIPKMELRVKVVKQLSSTDFMIADETAEVELIFRDEVRKRAIDIELNKVIKLFGVQKNDSNKLIFTKHSFWIEDKKHSINVKGDDNCVKLIDLCALKPGDVIKGKLTVKCMELKSTSKTVKGTPYRKVTFADKDFAINATFWRNDVQKFENILTVGSVYELSNFSLDKYPLDTNNLKPKDINIRFSTVISKLGDENIPADFLDLELPKEATGTKGTIKYVTSIHSYLACTGNGGVCGKSIKDNKICDKCGINLSMVTPINAYKCDLVFFGDDNVIYHVTAFSSQLKNFETEGDSVEERLEELKSKQVSIKMTEKEDGYMLNKLIIHD